MLQNCCFENQLLCMGEHNKLQSGVWSKASSEVDFESQNVSGESVETLM